MSRRLDNYLRMYRRHSGLSQKEMAFLLGCREESKVSRYERRIRHPSFETSVAFRKIFGVSTDELFAGVVDKVEDSLGEPLGRDGDQWEGLGDRSLEEEGLGEDVLEEGGDVGPPRAEVGDAVRGAVGVAGQDAQAAGEGKE